MRNRFLGLTLIIISSAAGGLITACSTPQNQNRASNVTPTGTSGMQGMADGSMDHSMAMDLGSADANYELRFIDAMTPHHQGAVTMAKEAQQKSKRPEIKKLAEDIIKAQNKEITEMKQWRQAWYPQASSTPMTYDSKSGKMMPMSAQQQQDMMMNKGLGAANQTFDLHFINAMIPHHQSAVTMAEDARNKSKRTEVKQLAQNIITSQKAEIKQMQQWRQAWYQK